MRILVIDGSGGDGSLALVQHAPDGPRLLLQAGRSGRGGAEVLPGLLRELLRSVGWEVACLGLIAAVTGPGSFTGLRATLALAHGVALATGVKLQGVAVPEALRRTLSDGYSAAGAPPYATAGAPPHGPAARLPSIPIWCVGMARRDRVFLDRGAACGPQAFMLDALPLPEQPVLLAGDACVPVAARIGQAGGMARSSGVERPDARAVAMIALDRKEGRLPPLPALPLYVDAPEAKRPASGLRAAPS